MDPPVFNIGPKRNIENEIGPGCRNIIGIADKHISKSPTSIGFILSPKYLVILFWKNILKIDEHKKDTNGIIAI